MRQIRQARDIPGTYDYIKHNAIVNKITEPNVWGRKINPKVGELREKMWNRYPTITDYRIPREVGDRIDINIHAKIIYGFIP